VSRGLRGQYDMAIFGASSDNNDPDGLTVVLDAASRRIRLERNARERR
jgi:peptide/nickel transport system substrate-binding protein